MKKQLTLFGGAVMLTIAVGTCFPSNSLASTTSAFPMEYSLDESIDWTLIQIENGIAVSFSMVLVDGDQFLSIKFENTTEESIDFQWSLLNNSSRVTITEDEMQEDRITLSAAEQSVYDGSYIVPVGQGESFDSYSVSIQLIK